MSEKRIVNAGIIGCGNISTIYLTNCGKLRPINVVACADLSMERARAQAAKFGIRAVTVEELLADTEIGVVINLTIPAAHGSVGMAALRVGKSVYNEKPLAITREDGQALVREARQANLRVGCAPDTFMGGGLQMCREVIDAGMIGEPVAATAFMLGHGPEAWHPDPEFFYEVGAGPMFDIGPYYLTALVSLLGPVRRVTGSTRISFAERVIGSGAKRGNKIKVTTPTHIAGVLDFASGPIATVVMSFDVWASEVPRLEIYGSKGTLSLPDPNGFGGPVRVRLEGENEWQDVPVSHGYTENSRGIGVADMVEAIEQGRPHRASGELAYHVLDLMHAIHEASDRARHVEVQSVCERPEPLPADIEQRWGSLG